MLNAFQLIDRCVDEYEAQSRSNTYARICGLTLLKAKNLALGSYSLILDGLGQEAGALLRPMIEYMELLGYLHKFPLQAERAAENALPSAGLRAKAIGGDFRELRVYLNQHASHSSYSSFSLSHLLAAGLSFRKVQNLAPHVLETNLRDLTIHLVLLIQASIQALQPLNSNNIQNLALDSVRLTNRMLHVFELENFGDPAPS